MAIFDELKSVGKVLQEAGKIPQYQQILEVQEKLLEMQSRIFGGLFDFTPVTREQYQALDPFFRTGN